MRLGLISAIRPQVLHTATWIYSQFRSGGSPRPGLRILMYHAIGTPIEGDVRCLYNITFARFEMQMRYLAEHYRNHLVPLDHSALKRH